MAGYTLEQIREWNPNWSGRNPKDPGDQFSIKALDGMYWNFTKDPATNTYTSEKSDKPFKVPASMNATTAWQEMRAGTYGSNYTNVLSSHPAKDIIQQALMDDIAPPETVTSSPAAAAAEQTSAEQTPAAAEQTPGTEQTPAAAAATGQSLPQQTIGALELPANPTEGMIYQHGGSGYIYKYTNGQWVAQPRQQTQTPAGDAAPETNAFDPANQKLQRYIQGIVYGRNLQGVYSRGNVDKAYMGLVQRGYTPEQAHQALEAFHGTMQRRPGFGVIDSGLAKARAMREDMYAGWQDNENTARQLRQGALAQQPPSLEQQQQSPEQPPEAVNKQSLLQQQYGVTIQADNHSGDIVGSDGKHYRWYPKQNKWGLIEEGTSKAPKQPIPRTSPDSKDSVAWNTPIPKPQYSEGWYVTRPKKSVLKAIRQWRHGT